MTSWYAYATINSVFLANGLNIDSLVWKRCKRPVLEPHHLKLLDSRTLNHLRIHWNRRSFMCMHKILRVFVRMIVRYWIILSHLRILIHHKLLLYVNIWQMDLRLTRKVSRLLYKLRNLECTNCTSFILNYPIISDLRWCSMVIIKKLFLKFI